MTLSNSQRRYQRRFALLVAFALAVSVLPFDLPGVPLPAAEAGPPAIEIYLVPLPEEAIRDGSLALHNGTSDDVRTIISITGAVDGTFVYYDHWEDGFELDLSSPVQATTETWGDGNVGNGAPPGCVLDSCDTFGAGDNAARRLSRKCGADSPEQRSACSRSSRRVKTRLAQRAPRRLLDPATPTTAAPGSYRIPAR